MPSLPRFHRWDTANQCVVIDQDGIAAAEAAALQRATPERLAKSYGHHIGVTDRLQRVLAAPLDGLHARRALDPDPECNKALYEAGQRYRHHWHRAGLCTLSAQDITRVGGSGGAPGWAIPPSEAAAWHRGEYHRARDCLGAYLARWLDAIVIKERAPLEVGRETTRYTDKTTATAIAMEILRSGLGMLASHWGMTRRRGASI
jgi:hypothetical protein